ncbi:MAG: hypothetical protein L6Q76_07680 [Polyangiaceae bacterium]|nr:hypothetical protein [Polyangiaceae bacterium]
MPPDDSDPPVRDETPAPSAGGAQEAPEGPRPEPGNLGILFLAAAIALALLLTIIGLLAFAAMSRTPPARAPATVTASVSVPATVSDSASDSASVPASVPACPFRQPPA